MSKYLAVTFLLACAEARFGQEQIPVAAVSALTSFGQPGDAGTLSGAVPGVLLAAANPCEKLSLGDKIVATLGTDPAVISAAAGVVAAEQNFNPFNVDIPSICGDATLPATAELRGIVPLVDPAVVGSDTENANSATSLTTPFSASGLSVAEVMSANGFSNFTSVDANGNSVAVAAAAAGSATANATDSATDSASASSSTDTAANSGAGCTASAPASSSNSTASASTAASASSSSTNTTTSLAGADFGICTPTMDFQFGRAQFNRKATEGTFFPTDPTLVASTGQSDALNPNIITNFICDQLTNVCQANQAAKDACASAKATVASLGTKDQTTADAFNQALGF